MYGERAPVPLEPIPVGSRTLADKPPVVRKTRPGGIGSLPGLFTAEDAEAAEEEEKEIAINRPVHTVSRRGAL